MEVGGGYNTGSSGGTGGGGGGGQIHSIWITHKYTNFPANQELMVEVMILVATGGGGGGAKLETLVVTLVDLQMDLVESWCINISSNLCWW